MINSEYGKYLLKIRETSNGQASGFDGLLLISHKLLKDKRGIFKSIVQKMN